MPWKDYNRTKQCARKHYAANKDLINAESRRRWREDPEYRRRKSEANKKSNAKRRDKVRPYARNYYAKNREHLRKLHTDWVKNARLQTLKHYGGDPPHCACCGEDHIEFLTIDHINGGGCKHRRTVKYGQLGEWLRSHGFPEGFQVLCWNCNLAKANYKKCPHQNG